MHLWLYGSLYGAFPFLWQHCLCTILAWWNSSHTRCSWTPSSDQRDHNMQRCLKKLDNRFDIFRSFWILKFLFSTLMMRYSKNVTKQPEYSWHYKTKWGDSDIMTESMKTKVFYHYYHWNDHRREELLQWYYCIFFQTVQWLAWLGRDAGLLDEGLDFGRWFVGEWFRLVLCWNP